MKQRIFDRARFVALVLVTILTFSCIYVPVSAYTPSDEIEVTIQHDQDSARSMLPLINQLRANPSYTNKEGEQINLNPAPALAYDYSLEKIAIMRAEDLGRDFVAGVRPDGTPFGEIKIDGMSSNSEILGKGPDVVSAFNYMSEIDDGTGGREHLIDSKFKSVAVGHVKFNGIDYWVIELSMDCKNTTPTEPNNSITNTRVSIDMDKAIMGATINGDSALRLQLGDEIDLPEVQAKLSYGTVNHDAELYIPDSQLTLRNWRCDDSTVQFEGGKLKALNKNAIGTYIYVDCEFSGKTTTASVLVYVTEKPTGDPTPTPRPNLVDLTPDSDKNITVRKGSTVTLTVLYNDTDYPTFFDSIWFKGDEEVSSGSASYTFVAEESANYSCDLTARAVGGGYGNIVVNFTVNVVDELYTITDNTPDSQKNFVAKSGESVTLQALATGHGNLSYQWQQKIGNNYQNVSNGNTSSYKFNFTYSTSYRCVVSDTYGNSINIDYTISSSNLQVSSNQTYFQAVNGQNLLLKVNASTNTGGNLSYSWTKDGQPITNTDATIPVLVQGDADYVCTVTDSFDNASKSITFTIRVHAFSAKAETEQIFYVASGTRVSMGVSGTSNTGTVTYQWYEGSRLINNEKTPNFSFNAYSTTEYKCVVSDGISTEEVKFNIYVPTLSLSSPRTSFTVKSGASIDMEVVAASTDTDKDLSYTWFKDGTKVSGSESTLSATVSDSCTYSCEVNDGYNTATIEFTVTIADLTAYAEKDTVYAANGGSATLKVITDSDTCTYTWYKANGNKIAGQTTSSYVVTNVKNTSSFYCVVSEGNKSVTVNFQVVVPTLTASADKSTYVVAKNSTVDLKVNATASGSDKTITYTWKDGSTVLSEGESDTYKLTANFTSSKAITCEVNDGYNTVSVNFTVKVPVLTASAVSDTSFIQKNGDEIQMIVSASSPDSDKPITYTWKKNGTVLSETTSTLSETVNGEADYVCTVYDGYTSIDLEFTVSVPSLVIDSTSDLFVTAASGKKVNMSVSAHSTKPVTYNWYLNDSNTSVGTASSYSPVIDGSCTYRCVVSDGFNSQTITFTISVPSISLGENETELYVENDTSITLTANATSDSGLLLTRKWYRGYSFLGSEETYTFTVNSQTATTYYCDVTDGVNTVRITYHVTRVKLSLERNCINPKNVNSGSSYTLKVSAGGTGTFTYKWIDPDGQIMDSTTNECVIYPTKSGKYYCEVSNGYLTKSIDFDITVPTISATASGNSTFSIKAGGSVTMGVDVDCNTDYMINWYILPPNSTYGSLLSDYKNQSSITINNITASTKYFCQVVSSANDSLRARVDFTVNVEEITANAENSTVYVKSGSNANLKVVTDPSLTGLSYAWYKKGSSTPISGATSASYTPTVTEDTAYVCKVSKGSSSVDVEFNVIVPKLTIDSYSGDDNVVTSGTFVVMSVSASSPKSDVGITYRWIKDGVEQTGEKSSSVGFTAYANTQYKCVVSDGYNEETITFDTVIPTLNVTASTAQKFSVKADETVELGVTVTANGSDMPITYTWTKNGQLIENADKDTYSFKASTGTYKCTVSDGYNTSSVEFTVTVSTLTAQAGIVNTTLYSKPNVSNTLSVAATSSLPVTYKWYANDALVNGETGSTYSPAPSTTTNYTCRVSDGVNTADVSFKIIVPELSVSGGKNIVAASGEEFTMQVFATSDSNKAITYQWYKGNSAISGETSSTCKTSTSGATSYSCKISDGYTEKTVEFTVSIPSFSAEASTDTDIKVKSGSKVTMGVTATSEGSDQSLSYTWMKGSEVLSNEKSNELTAYPSDNCTYSCVVSDGHNSKTISFTITVPKLVSSAVSSSEVIVASNATAKLQVSASSSEPVSYSWYVSGSTTPISGATKDTYSPTVSASASYVCKITDGYNTAEYTFSVKVPSLTADAATKTFKVKSGDPVSMQVNASTDYGNDITYHWYTSSNDQPVAGEASDKLTVNPTASIGYYCLVSDGYNSKKVEFTISVPTLTVSASVTSFTIVAGDDQALSISATTDSGNQITYSWYEKGKENTVLGTGTSVTVSPTQSTVYTCKVGDGFNEKTMDFTVSVDQPNLKDATSEDDRNKIVKKGASVTLTAKVESNTTVTYQWQYLRNGSFVNDNTNNGKKKTYSVSPSESTQYRCVVTNKNGASIRIIYNVTVPTLTDNTTTTSYTISKNTSVDLSVNIEGTGDLTYVWKKGSQTLSVSDPSLNTGNLQSSATYTCKVSDGYGNSKTVTFTITVPTLALNGGNNETVNIGKNKEFTLDTIASGTGKLTYSWTRIEGNSSSAVGSDSSTFNSHESSDVKYTCTVTDTYGNSVTKTFSIKVHSFTVVQSDSNVNIYNGDSCDLSVTVNGATGTVNYSWKAKGSDEIIGTGSSIKVKPNKTTEYSCTVSDSYYEETFTFTVIVGNAVLTDNTSDSAKNQTVANGSTVVMTPVILSSEQEISYQWARFENGTWTNIDGASASSYSPKVNSTSKFRCTVTDAYGNSCEVVFDITVPVLEVAKDSYSYKVGKNKTFNLVPIIKSNTGNTPSYQWYKDGAILPNETSATFTGALGSSAKYTCVIRDELYNNTQTVTFDVTVYSLTANADESSLTVVKGNSVQIGVTAETTSNNAISYKWYSASNSPESEMTDYTVAKISVTPEKDTSYRCEVSDGYNTESVSINVVVTVTPTPNPTTNPTTVPTTNPTGNPTTNPTTNPTANPTANPTGNPTTKPTTTTAPTAKPTATTKPTANPTTKPTTKPTATVAPTNKPTATTAPTAKPTYNPNKEDNIMAFVERMYSCVLARGVDKSGAEYWSNQLYEFNFSGADVAYRFLDSEEFKGRNTSDGAYVEILYRTFFNREPEPEGFNYWLGRLKAGDSRKTVADGFIMSQEWADTCARYGIRSGGTVKPSVKIAPSDKTNAFVERMYTTCLKRDYDKDGRDYWANRLSNFDITGEQLGLEFFMSEEFRGKKLSDEEFINRLYKTFMNREPEGEGKAFWLEFTKTHTRRETVLGFTRSEEFRKLCIEARILPC